MATQFKSCSIDGCNGNAHWTVDGKRGWCSAHYQKWKTYGDPLGSADVRPPRLCSIPDCSQSHEAHGWCKNHYRRWRKNGDPLIGVRVTPVGACSESDCDRPAKCRGLCERHYNRLRYQTRVPKDFCPIDNCGKPVKCGGLCSAHYQRRRTHGDPLSGGTPHGAPMSWLDEHLNHSGLDCLKWPFGPNINIGGIYIVATRLMCALAHGAPPSDIHEAAHSCGKAHEGCINPNHLSWKTPKENAADKIIHGTHDRGENHVSSILTESDVREIRRLQGIVLQRVLADRYGVCSPHICAVQNENAWAWLV